MDEGFRKNNRVNVLLTACLIVLCSCAKTSVSRTDSTPDRPSNLTAGSNALQIEVPPLWEAKVADGQSWTQFSAEVITKQAPNLLLGSSDIKSFCPNYFAMSPNQKVNFWTYLISGVAKYESAFDPTDRMKETGLGVDPITHRQVYSEGLLQLSYQDVLKYPYCDEFNWAADSKLSAKDPRKTILSPTKNLFCGILILNQLVGEHDKIAFSPGHYWSTLEPGHRNGKVAQLQKLTKQLSFCKND